MTRWAARVRRPPTASSSLGCFWQSHLKGHSDLWIEAKGWRKAQVTDFQRVTAAKDLSSSMIQDHISKGYLPWACLEPQRLQYKPFQRRGLFRNGSKRGVTRPPGISYGLSAQSPGRFGWRTQCPKREWLHPAPCRKLQSKYPVWPLLSSGGALGRWRLRTGEQRAATCC